MALIQIELGISEQPDLGMDEALSRYDENKNNIHADAG